VRPLLVLAACTAVGGAWKRALPAAVAVECAHAFSLVHDDLPAMDDDDYRRGRLTTHKKFGEALGVLAGDALLAFAFEELSRLAGEGVPAPRVVEAVRRLGHATGALQLVGGQALDIGAEGRKPSARQVRDIHERKTGALFGASLALGRDRGRCRHAHRGRARGGRPHGGPGVPDPGRSPQRERHVARHARQAPGHRRGPRQGDVSRGGGGVARTSRGGGVAPERPQRDRTRCAKPELLLGLVEALAKRER
jgi:hypothetical protein